MTSTHPRILVVEDNFDICEVLTLSLAVDGYEVEFRLNQSEGLAALSEKEFDLAVMDLGFEGEVDFGYIMSARKLKPLMPLIVYSAHAETRFAERAINAGATAFVPKPYLDELIEKILSVLREQIVQNPS
jgi:DNA-binding NtrC family response regulator